MQARNDIVASSFPLACHPPMMTLRHALQLSEKPAANLQRVAGNPILTMNG
jgi:hypothetical protein